MSVVFAGYLLVEQMLPHFGSPGAVTWYTVDSIDWEAEAIGLILDGQLQPCVDLALFPYNRARGCCADHIGDT